MDTLLAGWKYRRAHRPIWVRCALIKVIIADDHPLVRFAVRRCLEWEESVEVVGEARTGREAVDLTLRHRPDAVLLDYHMPVLDGIDAARTITGQVPEVAILMLTAEENPVLEEAAGQAGVRRLIRKDEPPEALLRTLYQVLAEVRGNGRDRFEVVVDPEGLRDRAP
jgi:DNA-binding NarL/FixJ family response regulator